ncbi:serine/threonine-protein kinase [Cryobacterium sp. TMT2-18-3]|nr:serine/threonine-protein kinase [Cryobacterium sp. TMT2-18-2]TFC67707.1 serine/threonine-protein kinase [Cryobacterium sp. TMT2-18-3]
MGCRWERRRRRRPATNRRCRPRCRPLPLPLWRAVPARSLARRRVRLQPRRFLRERGRRDGRFLRRSGRLRSFVTDKTPAGDGLISGRYRLGDLLGTGGSASVFAAVDTATFSDGDVGAHRAVALKILHPHLSRSDHSRRAFLAEATAAAGLRHPNIAQVLGIGVHDTGEEPQAWIALELVPGITLAEHIERNGALEPGQALTIASAVLRALEASHARGLIHRDVSPANIMVDTDDGGGFLIGDVRLLDFGLADAAGRPVLGTDVLRSAPAPQAREDQKAPGLSIEAVAPGVLGSVYYMSPEQARGGVVDERGDLYQLGGVLHFVLTGKPPFSRDSAAAVMRAHVLAPPPVPSVLRSGIPRAVDRIVVKALMKDPASRFQSAAEMAGGIGILIASGVVGPAGRGRAAGDERTRVFGQTAAPASDEPGSVAPGSEAPAGDLPGPDWARSGRTRSGSGLWLLALLVVGGIAVGWVVAAGGSEPASIAVASSLPTSPPTPSPVPATDGISTDILIQRVRMPELTSLTLAAARAALAEAGLEVGAVETQASALPADTVLASLPAEGTRIDPGRTVDLVIASGSNAIPTVRGLTQAAAAVAFEEAGFVVLTESRADSTVPPGTVLASLPAAQTVWRLGTTVTLIVASAAFPVPEVPPTPAPTSTSQTPTHAPTNAPDPGATPAPAATSASR